ncbi:MAG: hypothetical protein IPP38_14360 [Bacteroidetes bacterium]|nr:hypothetical protein [Bacteroidota bacterium]
MKRHIHFLFFFFLLIGACKKDKIQNGSGSAPQLQLTSYPLSIGNSWKYYSEMHLVNSLGNSIQDDYYDIFWEVVSDTIIHGLVCSKISQVDSNYNGSVYAAHTYYTNKPDGFYGVAVEDQGSMLYLRTSEEAARTRFDLLGSFGNKFLTTDSVYVPDTSLKFLKFPSNINDIWFSYEYNGPGGDVVKRKYIKDTVLTTNAGIFNCIKLRLFWDNDNNNLPDSGRSEIYQYFSSKA